MRLGGGEEERKEEKPIPPESGKEETLSEAPLKVVYQPLAKRVPKQGD